MQVRANLREYDVCSKCKGDKRNHEILFVNFVENTEPGIICPHPVYSGVYF
jgi:recombinational DNA repair protein RecR